MKLIIGIGNPGEKYKGNRHNVGHMIADKLKTQRQSRLLMSKVKNVMVVKTDTFMNESGDFVKKLVEQYKVNASDLWVIHDDLDIKLGDYKIQKGRGPKVHNGLLSIYEKLGTKDFWHVRIGVDNRDPEKKIPGEEYVLEDFREDEIPILKRAVNEVVRKLLNE